MHPAREVDARELLGACQTHPLTCPLTARQGTCMTVIEAFRDFQAAVDADPAGVREARARRDTFIAALSAESDVLEVFMSGSLARKTQKDPIHDLDLVIVFDEAAHPDWGQPGDSAADALDHLQSRVHALLGATDGTHAHLVRLARWRNHAVKCFIDDPGDDAAFTVDAMPALRRGGALLIPEALSSQWVACDPESLTAAVATKQAQWNKYVGTVRMLKQWAAEQDIKIKSLVMEVLALDFLPLEVEQQPSAVKSFFVSSAFFITGGNPVHDPARLCGPIQADLDYEAFGDLLCAARDTAAKAIQAQLDNNTAKAIEHWGSVFGDFFPLPPAGSAGAATTGPRPVKDTPQG